MKRRTFITLFGGAAITWPVAVHAQTQRMRHVGILLGSADNTVSRSRLDAFLQAFRRLGWTEGQNVHLEIRWGANDQSKIAANAKELVGLKPDVILVGPSNTVIALLKETRSTPIVFVDVSDPIGQGVVDSLARPTGNVTGFSALEFSLIGKWLQLLKEAAPGLKRVGLMISTINTTSPRWYQHFDATARKFAIEPIATPIRNRTEDIEATIKSIAAKSNGALIVPGDTFVGAPPVRRLLIALTASYRLPVLHSARVFASEGGLMSYGIDRSDPYRRAASYVDRILKGETPADLPIQQPTKFHFAINLKTAKALGLELSPTLVATADEVVE